jgi:hypothetical protein
MQHCLTHLILHLATYTRAQADSNLRRQEWEIVSPPPSSLEQGSSRIPVKIAGAAVKGSSSSRSGGGRGGGLVVGSNGGAQEPLVRLSDGCLDDMRRMLASTVPNCEAIVGVDAHGERTADDSIRAALVQKGVEWGRHVREPWVVTCLAAAYILSTITLGCPFFWGIAHLIMFGAGVYETIDLGWSLARPLAMPAGQSMGWLAIGFVLRLADAVLYVYVAKLASWALCYAEGRPLWGRLGKRTLVIVDSPTNHQLLEAFCSKLFAQAYSFCSIDVHGASGVGVPRGPAPTTAAQNAAAACHVAPCARDLIVRAL